MPVQAFYIPSVERRSRLQVLALQTVPLQLVEASCLAEPAINHVERGLDLQLALLTLKEEQLFRHLSIVESETRASDTRYTCSISRTTWRTLTAWRHRTGQRPWLKDEPPRTPPC